jgi:hypothetical protein
VPSGTKQVVVTPTATSSFASITVNDKTITTSSAINSYLVDSVNTFDPIIINVTAGDGVTVSSYAVSVVAG